MDTGDTTVKSGVIASWGNTGNPNMGMNPSICLEAHSTTDRNQLKSSDIAKILLSRRGVVVNGNT